MLNDIENIYERLPTDFEEETFNEQVFNVLKYNEKELIRTFLEAIGEIKTNWDEPSEKCLSNIIFGLAAIKNFNYSPNKTAQAYLTARKKAFEAMEKFMNDNPKATLEDFGGHWGNLKAHLDYLYEESQNVWRRTYKMYFPIHHNPYTGEPMRVQ